MTTFEAMYSEQLGYVLQSLRRLGAPASRLEDLAHDVFVTVHRRLGDYDARRPLRPWLFGICHGLWANERALARNRSTHEAADELVDDDDPHRHSERREAQRLVREALRELDEDKRAVFILHELDEVPVSEAAAVLGLNTDTAWSRLKAARRQFKDAMARRLGPTKGAAHG